MGAASTARDLVKRSMGATNELHQFAAPIQDMRSGIHCHVRLAKKTTTRNSATTQANSVVMMEVELKTLLQLKQRTV